MMRKWTSMDRNLQHRLQVRRSSFPSRMQFFGIFTAKGSHDTKIFKIGQSRYIT